MPNFGPPFIVSGAPLVTLVSGIPTFVPEQEILPLASYYPTPIDPITYSPPLNFELGPQDGTVPVAQMGGPGGLGGPLPLPTAILAPPAVAHPAPVQPAVHVQPLMQQVLQLLR